MKKRSSARVSALVKRAEKYVEGGMSIKDACDKVNLNPSAWHQRKHRAKRMEPSAKAASRTKLTISAPAPEAGKLTVIIGTPEQIREVLRG